MLQGIPITGKGLRDDLFKITRIPLDAKDSSSRVKAMRKGQKCVFEMIKKRHDDMFLYFGNLGSY